MDAGCGNSELIQNLVDDGFENVVGVDFSRVAIDQLKKRCEDYPEIELMCLNMQDTNLPESSFDCILDKGLLDSIACNLQSTDSVANYVCEIERLLVNDGVFICISLAAPDERLKYLEIYDIDLPNFTPWYTDVVAMEKPREYDAQETDEDDMASYYFVYICRVEPKLVKQKKDRVKQLINKKKKAAKARKKNHKNDL
jgi:ubiquinone/menaquinone biosynthesis C-methylase UbiE